MKRQSAAPARAPYVKWKKTGATAIVLNLTTGDYLELDPTAFDIWRLIDGRRSTREIARTLAVAYRAPAATVEPDVVRFVAALRRRKMLTREATRRA
jgi:hypothetical protein